MGLFGKGSVWAGCTNIAFVKLVTELMPVVIILITSITVLVASNVVKYLICQSQGGCTNIAFVKLVTELMPVVADLILVNMSYG